MNAIGPILRLAALCGLALAIVAPGRAADGEQKSTLTVERSIEAPGALLDPGVYVIKVVDNRPTRRILRILDEQESKVILTMIALPNYRLKMPQGAEFSWYERPEAWPPALRAWFYPGDGFGLELVYPKRQAATIAQMAQVTVPSLEDGEEPLLTAEVAPGAPVPSELNAMPIRPTEPMQIAQAQPESAPAPPPPAAQPAPERQAAPEMPPAAGSGALFVLVGILSLAAAAKLGTAFRGSR